MKIGRAIALALALVMMPAAPVSAADASTSSSICDIDPNVSYYSWFAHAFGYCN